MPCPPWLYVAFTPIGAPSQMSFRPGVLYHPNVSKDGEICGDTIAKTFGPTKYITDLARMVR